MGNSIFFVKTVPEVVDENASLKNKLKVTVNNTGNYFFEHAVARQLSGFSTVSKISDIPEDDAVVVLSMSNFISPYTNMGGICDQLEKKRVSKVVMIGAGAQAYDYDSPISVSPGTKRFLDILSDRGCSIGVRGYFTADKLNDLGIKNIDVIGCPSIFYHCDSAFKVVPPSYRDGLKTVFHCTPSGYYRDAIAKMINFGVRNCHAYIAQSEKELFGLYSDDEEDLRMTEFFFKYYNDGVTDKSVVRKWFLDNAVWFFSLPEWLSYMSTVDFSLGARFHGNMAAILNGVPALNIVFDTRTRELCEYLNLPHIRLEDFDPNLGLDYYYSRADYSLFNATYRKKFKVYRDFLLKNGLETTLMDPVSDEYVLPACQVASVQELVNDAVISGYNGSLDNEIRLRTKRFRDEATRKAAEAGKLQSL